MPHRATRSSLRGRPAILSLSLGRIPGGILAAGLLAVLALGLLASPAARAEEEPTAVERRLQVLIDLVGRLQEEVALLRRKVAVLEREIRDLSEPATEVVLFPAEAPAPEPGPADPPAPVPAPPSETPPGPAPEPPRSPPPPAPGTGAAKIATFVGAWVLDVEASRRASLEQATSEAEDPEEAAALRAMVEEALAGVEMEVLFAEDGTFRATMSTEEMGAHGAAGTWTIDGAAAVLTASTEDGEEQDDPESVRFALVDDRLRFEAGGPMVFVLRRR